MSIDHNHDTDPVQQDPATVNTPTEREHYDFPVWERKKPERKKSSGKAKLFALVGGVAIATAITTSLIVGHKSDTDNDNKNPNEGAKPVATATSLPSPEASASTVPNTSEIDPSAAEVLKQTTSIEAMQEMSIDDFASLPYADRAAYMISRIPADVSVLSSLSDVKGALADKDQIPDFYWMQQIGVAYGEANQEDGVKDSLGRTYYVKNDSGDVIPSIQELINDVLANGGEGVGVSTSLTFEGAGEFQKGTDVHGNPIEWFNVTVTPLNDNTQKSGETVTSQAILTPIQLMSGETVYMWAEGLTVDGKVSPVPGSAY